VLEGFNQHADGVEVDIRLTADKEIICHHDKNALRTTGTDRLIREMTLDEVSLLECGSWFGEAWRGEKVPELTKILSILPKGKEIFIEVKTNEVIVPYLIEDIYRQNIDIDKITIISFFPEVIRSVKKHNPKLKCNLLIAFDYKRIEVNEILDSVLSIDANGVGAQNHDRLNKELIGSLKEIGKSTHVWTVDSDKEAERYLKLGINSITTNKPLFLRKHLKLLQLP
jgi:glycerophosphoryl diester phosphodiesterase